ncbi:MAG: hypothetical protein H5T84_11410, partial [Thermoleophilia bacterium]|nr:hypothetical protein [Thermoleophilia bacterium]
MGSVFLARLDSVLAKLEPVIARIDPVLNYARAVSFWPVTFGLACCAIEMMAAGASRFDIA